MQIEIKLRPTDAARALRVSTETLRRWRMTGEGPAFDDFDGVARYPVESLQQFAERRGIPAKGLRAKC